MRVLKYATLALACAAVSSVQAGTLDDVKARGELNCIVSTGLAGFAAPDADGKWQGLDVDFCRAVAAAVLGDAEKVKFVPSTGKTRFTLLNSGEGDIMFRNTTETMSRDADLKLTFLPVNYYDGQGFMIPKAMGVTSAKELDGASVCIQTGTTTELNLADYFRVNGLSYEPVPIETNDESRSNYLAGRCDVFTTDASGLASTRASFEKPDEHVLLPEIISKEPLGGAVRHGDDQWADIGKWVVNAIISAEESGVTMENVEEMAMIGLDNQWAVRAIAAVGNYAEIFERHIGVNTPIGLARGLNAQWKDGGILYAAPIR